MKAPHMLAGHVTFESAEDRQTCHVSNGEQIVEVGKDGGYRLPWEDGRHRFAFVIPPDGYLSVGRWWHTVRPGGVMPAVNFVLRRHRPRTAGDTFSFLHITDFHVRESAPPPGDAFGKTRADRIDLPTSQHLRVVLDDLLALSPGIEFIVATGDLTDNGDEESIRAAARTLNALPLPVFTIFGGHDGNAELRAAGGDQYNVETWTQHLSPPYYSWNWGGRHFISFVSETTKYLDPTTRQMHDSFIAEDVRLFSRDRPTTVCSHKHPYPWNVGVFHEGQVDSWFHGHFHSTRVMQVGGIRVFSTGTPLFGGLDGCVAPARIVHIAGSAAPTAPFIVPPHSRGRKTIGAESSGRLVRRWRSAFGRLSHVAQPHVVNDRIYCAAVDYASGVEGGLACLSTESGEMKWFTRLEASVEAPVAVLNDRIFVVTQIGQVACLDAASGRVVWRHALAEQHDRWIYAPPLIVRDSIVVGTTSMLVCLGEQGGEKRWEFRDERKSCDAFGQFQTPLHHDGKLFLAGYKTGSYMIDAGTGRVLRAHDDRDVRYTSRVIPHEHLYIIGDGIGGLSCFDLATGDRLWRRQISSNVITSAFVPFRGGLLGGTAEGLTLCAVGDGQVLNQRAFGEDIGLYIAYRGAGTGVRSCPGTPWVRGDLAWAASGDGYVNLLRGASLEVIDRLPLDAPILSPLIGGPGETVLGISSDGVLNCFAARE